MNKKYILGFLCLFSIIAQTVVAQQSIKRSKQKTKFHYLQSNLHIGYLNNGDNNYIDFLNQGPANNITYQFLSKNQRRLQRGYTKFATINKFKLRVSLKFKGGINNKNFKEDVLNLNLQNLGFSFATKWDKTSFFVGYGSVQFGHNPKIDPVSDFTSNITKNDVGFNQDLGVFFKSPISYSLVGEIGVSTGGVFSKPLVSYNSTVGVVDYLKLNYNNTWLVTGRIGAPSFKTFEYGVLAMVGNLEKTVPLTRRVNRVGVDLLKKFGETCKIGLLGVVGNTINSNSSNEFNKNFQGNIEYYLKGKYIFNISNGILMTDYKDKKIASTIKGQWINSLSYVVSPHTRIRFNNFVNYSRASTPDIGFTLQLITGFGRR